MIDRDREWEARDMIRGAGYEVMPFGWTEWRDDCPRLAELVKQSTSALRVAPDNLVETVHGPAWVETMDCRRGDYGDRAVSLAKLDGLPLWAQLVPVFGLDVNNQRVFPFRRGWAYDVTDNHGPRPDGPMGRGDQKAYAWLRKTHDRPFSFLWPDR